VNDFVNQASVSFNVAFGVASVTYFCLVSPRQVQRHPHHETRPEGWF
jgi:hypothetical protein